MSLTCIPIYLPEWERGEATASEQEIIILYNKRALSILRASWKILRFAVLSMPSKYIISNIGPQISTLKQNFSKDYKSQKPGFKCQPSSSYLGVHLGKLPKPSEPSFPNASQELTHTLQSCHKTNSMSIKNLAYTVFPRK